MEQMASVIFIKWINDNFDKYTLKWYYIILFF